MDAGGSAAGGSAGCGELIHGTGFACCAQVRTLILDGMSQGSDTPDLSMLPPEARRLVEAERAARQAVEAHQAELEAKNADLAAENEQLRLYTEKLERLIKEHRQARFGPGSEKLEPDQQELAFEDVETAIEETREAHDSRTAGADQEQGQSRKRTRTERTGKVQRRLPKHLPTDEQWLEPDDITCPCGCGEMVRIGEERSSRLDVTWGSSDQI